MSAQISEQEHSIYRETNTTTFEEKICAFLTTTPTTSLTEERLAWLAHQGQMAEL
jgi:hypothetical protein